MFESWSKSNTICNRFDIDKLKVINKNNVTFVNNFMLKYFFIRKYSYTFVSQFSKYKPKTQTYGNLKRNIFRAL